MEPTNRPRQKGFVKDGDFVYSPFGLCYGTRVWEVYREDGEVFSIYTACRGGTWHAVFEPPMRIKSPGGGWWSESEALRAYLYELESRLWKMKIDLQRQDSDLYKSYPTKPRRARYKLIIDNAIDAAKRMNAHLRVFDTSRIHPTRIERIPAAILREAQTAESAECATSAT